MTVQGWADDLLQPTRQLPGAVQNERGFECFVEVELAADKILEDRRPAAELVDEVKLDGGDPGHLLLLIHITRYLVVEEVDELDVRKLVTFELG